MFKNALPILLLCISPFCQASGGPITVDPAASEFEVSVKATGHSFEVLLTEYKANLSLDENGDLQTAEFAFAPTALDSDSKKRDKKMLGWLESDTYKEISFRLDKVEDRPEGKVGIGQLTMHGVTKPVEVAFTKTIEGGKVTLKGEAVVNHEDFELEVITMFFFKVDPELKIAFTLVGTVEQ